MDRRKKALEIIDSLQDNYEYMDRYRVARVGDAEAEAEYERIRARGCCAFYDKVIEIDGQEWRIGFNYGH